MASKAAPELPGFYFDPERNRYFKLIPGQEHSNPVTGKRLIKEETEDMVNPPRKQLKLEQYNKQYLRNIHSIIGLQQAFHPFQANSFRQNVLKCLFTGKLAQNSCIPLKSRPSEKQTTLLLKPSDDYGKILRMIDISTLSVVECYDRDTRTLAHKTLSLPCYGLSRLHDFCHASVKHKNSGLVAVSTPMFAGSYVSLMPDTDTGVVQTKFVKEYACMCKWVDKHLLYSLGSKLVIVKNCDMHFEQRTVSAGAEILRTFTSPTNHLTSVECGSSVIFVGHLNGKVFSYDRRNLHSKCFSLSLDNSWRNACSMKLISNDYHLITRHCSTYDGLHLWDIRNTKHCLISYGAVKCSESALFQRMWKSFYLDVDEEVISCSSMDRKVRLWDVKSGDVLLETTDLDYGIFSKSWPLMKNDPGILGIKKRRSQWLPLQTSD